MSRRTGRAIAFVVAAAALAVIALLVVRWWKGPSPQGEAQEYFDRVAPGAATVVACTYAVDPEGSVFDRYYCTVAATRRVPREDPGNADVAKGRNGYCFIVPSAGSPWVRRDGDAFPYAQASAVTQCEGG